MEIIILGSGTGSPNPDRAPASALVRVGDRTALFDFGPGILRRLVQEGFDHLALDAICLTHFHPDHSLDLWAWMFTTTYQHRSAAGPVSLITEQGFGVVYEGLKLAYGGSVTPPPEVLDLVLIDREVGLQTIPTPHLPGLTIRAAPAEHQPESMAFRLDWEGKSMVYTGDTGWSDSVLELARDADCLIIEATRPNNLPAPGHLSPALAGKLARLAGVGRVVLTHLSAGHGPVDPALAARSEYSGLIQTARDGLRIDLG